MLMKTHANSFQLHFYFMINIANVVNRPRKPESLRQVWAKEEIKIQYSYKNKSLPEW